MNRDPNQEGNQSGEALAATQQVGDELPSGIRTGIRGGPSMDDPGASGALDPDDPSPTNTAIGVSMGGTGTGIEPGVDADLGLNDPAEPEEIVAEVYDEPAADMDFDRTVG